MTDLTSSQTAADVDPMADARDARALLGNASSMATAAPQSTSGGPTTAEPSDATDTEVLTEDDLFDDAEAEAPLSPFDRPGKWFVVHTQSGYEKKVKQNLEARMTALDMEEAIYEIEIPMEDVIEFKGGRKVVVRKKVFPGYLLIRCKPSHDTHHMIRETPGIRGYAGPGGKPSPLNKHEVERFLTTPDVGDDKPMRTKPSVVYQLDESVRIKEGPFADFQGQVIEINEDHLKVKVLVNIFGRETPVELDFAQVAKV